MNTPQYCGIIPQPGTAISLSQGMLLTSGGAHLTLRKFERGEIVLQNLATQECKAITEGALLQAIFDGKVSLVGSEQSDPVLGVALTRAQERGATTKAVRHATELMQWVTALRQRGVTAIRDAAWIRAEINALAKGELAHLPRFALSTLYEADLKLRKAQDDVGVLVPHYANRGGRGKLRIDPVAQQIMAEELEARLKEPLPRPLNILEIWQRVDDRISSHNVSSERAIAPVSESSVRRYVSREVPAFVRLELRVGMKKALKIFRSNSGARDVAARPLEMSEYDDTDSGVFCIDGRNGLPWGRAWLTNGVDQNTVAPLGYHLGTKPRSYDSAIGAICDSLLPKPDCLPGEMGYGVQGVMLVDNASYNVGHAMKHRCETEGLLFARARPFGSTEKSVIEYFNHRVKSAFCPTLPGWRGDKHNRDAIKKGMDSAILTVEEFSKAYRHWLTKIYANTPGADGYTPKQRWLKFYERHSPAIRYTPQQLELLRLRPESSSFRDSSGLLRLTLRYDCPALDELQRRLGPKAKVITYIPPSLTYIKVLNPFTNALIDVPCTEDHHYVTTTTEAQHRLILALQRTRKKTNPSLKDLVEGREILRQMVQEASESHKLRTRRWGMVVGVPAEAPTLAPDESITKQVEVVCSELEYQVAQLEEVDLADLGDWA